MEQYLNPSLGRVNNIFRRKEKTWVLRVPTTTKVAKDTKLKNDIQSFEENFIICSLSEVDFVLSNIFL